MNPTNLSPCHRPPWCVTLSILNIYLLPSFLAVLWVGAAGMLQLNGDLAYFILIVWLSICVLLAFHQSRMRFGNWVCAIPLSLAAIVVGGATLLHLASFPAAMMLVVWISICVFLVFDFLRLRYGAWISAVPAIVAVFWYAMSKTNLGTGPDYYPWSDVLLSIAVLLVFRTLRGRFGNWICAFPAMLAGIWLIVAEDLHLDEEMPYLVEVAFLSICAFVLLNQVRRKYSRDESKNRGLKIGYLLGAITAFIYFAQVIIIR